MFKTDVFIFDPQVWPSWRINSYVIISVAWCWQNDVYVIMLLSGGRYWTHVIRWLIYSAQTFNWICELFFGLLVSLPSSTFTHQLWWVGGIYLLLSYLLFIWVYSSYLLERSDIAGSLSSLIYLSIVSSALYTKLSSHLSNRVHSGLITYSVLCKLRELTAVHPCAHCIVYNPRIFPETSFARYSTLSLLCLVMSV